MMEQFYLWRDHLLLTLDVLSDEQLSKLARDVQALATYLSKTKHERRLKAMGEVVAG